MPLACALRFVKLVKHSRTSRWNLRTIREPADAANAVISAARGNVTDAVIDGVAMTGPLGNIFSVGRRVRKITKAADEVGEARSAGKATEGIYEFKDAASDGRTYVGQSGNVPERLKQHEKSGRLATGDKAKTTPVTGGKTQRELAEQKRIDKLGGTRNNSGSRTSNVRNPVSRERRRRLEKQ